MVSKRVALTVACSMLGVTCVAVAMRAVAVRQALVPRSIVEANAPIISVAAAPGSRVFYAGLASYAALKAHRNVAALLGAYDLRSRNLVRRFNGLRQSARAVTVTPDGMTVVAGDFGDVIAWDAVTGNVRWQTTDKKSAQVNGLSPISVSPDGAIVAIGNGLYDASTGKLLRRMGTQLASGDGESKFTPDGKWLGIIDSIDASQQMDTTGPSKDRFKKLFATARLRFWRTDNGTLALDLPFVRARAFDISSTGKWAIVTCDYDRNDSNGADGSIVRRVDLKTGAVAWSRQRNMNPPDNDADAILNSVAISPNGKFVVLESMTDRLIVLDAQSGRELFRPLVTPGQEAHWAVPYGVAFTPDGKNLISRNGRNILVWDTSRLIR